MPPQETTSVEKNQLTRGKLGVWGVIFLVISAAAPLTVVVSAAPLSFRLVGIGAPGAMLYCGAVLILFALGFTAMSNHVPNARAFHAYALHGLGKGPGIGLAFVTVFAYIFLCVSFFGFFGYFAHLTMLELASIDLPWWGFSALAIALVALLSVRQVDVGAKLLAALVTAEIAILLAISIAVLLMAGPEPISLAGINPKNIFFSGGVAGPMVIGFGAYLGFEGTAIYAEEARRPQRTIPIATYLAVTLLACFYAFTFRVLTVAFGIDGIIAFATGENFESMIFEASGSYLGNWVAICIQVLIVTSFFACILAFHNAAARYMYSLGRERILPAALRRISRRLPRVGHLDLRYRRAGAGFRAHRRRDFRGRLFPQGPQGAQFMARRVRPGTGRVGPSGRIDYDRRELRNHYRHGWSGQLDSAGTHTVALRRRAAVRGVAQAAFPGRACAARHAAGRT